MLKMLTAFCACWFAGICVAQAVPQAAIDAYVNKASVLVESEDLAGRCKWVPPGGVEAIHLVLGELKAEVGVAGGALQEQVLAKIAAARRGSAASSCSSPVTTAKKQTVVGISSLAVATLMSRAKGMLDVEASQPWAKDITTLGTHLGVVLQQNDALRGLNPAAYAQLSREQSGIAKGALENICNSRKTVRWAKDVRPCPVPKGTGPKALPYALTLVEDTEKFAADADRALGPKEPEGASPAKKQP